MISIKFDESCSFGVYLIMGKGFDHLTVTLSDTDLNVFRQSLDQKVKEIHPPGLIFFLFETK